MENPIKKYDINSQEFGFLLKNFMDNCNTCDCSGYEEREYFLYVANLIIEDKQDVSSDRLVNNDYTFAIRLNFFLNDIEIHEVEDDNTDSEVQALLLLKTISDALVIYQLETCPEEEIWYWKNLNMWKEDESKSIS